MVRVRVRVRFRVRVGIGITQNVKKYEYNPTRAIGP